MSVDCSNKAPDVYSIELPNGDNLEPDSACLGLIQFPNLFKSQLVYSAAAHLNSQDCIALLVGDPANYSPDPVDVENGRSLDNSSADEIPGNAKSESLVTHVHKALQRQVSGHLGRKFALHLVEYLLVLLRISPKADKQAAEKGHDASNNRWRRYKRSASFDSRRVVLFFSILSIIGTLILIYLTLRVRQIGEALVTA
ncbi:unnamed protein product [Rhodiola kirilowii]